MKEDKIIKATRAICRACGLRYQIRSTVYGRSLFLYSIITRTYIQVCFDLYNLTEKQIAEDVEHARGLYFCI